MKLKNLLYATPLALVIVGLFGGGMYGWNQKKECEARGGTYVRVSLGNECVKLEKVK